MNTASKRPSADKCFGDWGDKICETPTMSPQVKQITAGGSEIILPFNFNRNSPPRPQGNEIRPL